MRDIIEHELAAFDATVENGAPLIAKIGKQVFGKQLQGKIIKSWGTDDLSCAISFSFDVLRCTMAGRG
jgi:hypothetical protein